jgi:hypothetical protein
MTDDEVSAEVGAAQAIGKVGADMESIHFKSNHQQPRQKQIDR